MHGGCRDAVILQHQYEMPGSGVHYSVSDNLLVVHIGHSGRAQIIDVAGGGSAPVSAAQPFAMAPLGVRMITCVRLIVDLFVVDVSLELWSSRDAVRTEGCNV